MSVGRRGAKPPLWLAAAWLAGVLAVSAQPASAQVKGGSPPPAPAAATPDPRLIQPDPAVRRGVAPNGLRYAVMRNTSDTNISMRLGLDVGSFDEEAGEYGVAHLVEHLAFNASEGSERDLDEVFGARGVAFGRDQNAITTVNETIYRLDMPKADPETIRLGLKWMRGVADGLKVTPEAVAAERDVIAAERSMRRVAGMDAAEAVMAFQAPDVRSARLPIGTSQDIASFSAPAAKAFYERVYRPERAIVVIVGALPVSELERMVLDTFAAWTAPGEPPRRAVAGTVDFLRPPDVLARADPALPPAFSACRLRPPAEKIRGRVDVLRSRVASLAWLEVLNRRFAVTASSATPPFILAMAMSSEEWREAAGTCVVTSPVDGKWAEAVDAMHQEVRRFAATGPTAQEAEATLEAMRSRLRGAEGQASTRTSPDLANSVLALELAGEVFSAPKEAFRAFEVATEGMTAGDIKAAFLKDWSGSGPLLTAVGPNPPKAEEIRAIWREGERVAATAVVEGEAQATEWAYTAFGRPGRIAKTQRVRTGDFTRITFRNGVVLNVKESVTQSRNIEIRVRFGAGREEIANEEFWAATLGAALFKGAGLKRHSYQQVHDLFRDHSWDASLNVGAQAFVLKGGTTTSGLDEQLEILAAYVSEPGFEANIDARLPTAIDAMYRMFGGMPSMVMSQALAEAIQPGGPAVLPPKDVVLKYRMKDFQRILTPALVEAPLEVTIVGDVDTRHAVRHVARTFGALPRRTERKRVRGDTLYLKFPARLPPTIRVTHSGSPDRAIVAAVWPMFVATPERRREEVAAIVAGKVLGDRLNDRVRRELHLSYAPEVATVAPDHADQGYLAAVVETAPSQADKVLAEVHREALALARGEFDDAALERARKPFVAQAEATANRNDFWADLLSGSSSDPDRVADGIRLTGIAAEVTLDEVRASARTWLSATPLTVVAAPEPASTPR